jgi:hypothetical protein
MMPDETTNNLTPTRNSFLASRIGCVVIAIIGAIALVAFAFILRFVHHHNSLFHDQQVRTVIAGVMGIIVIVGAYHFTISSTQKLEVKYIIAFDVVFFIVAGLGALFSAATYWGTACLCAGSCLFGGGIIGLLFGLPLGSEAVKNQADQAQAAASKKIDTAKLATAVAVVDNVQPSAEAVQMVDDAKAAKERADLQAASSNRHNLLSDTASSLSKVLAGAGLAKYQDLLSLFKTTSATVTASITGGEGPGSVLGGALILYFGLAGFIAGLVLPAYFMANWQAGGGTDNSKT